VSIFALDCADALRVFEVAAAFDATDPYSCSERPVRSLDGLRFAVPRSEQLEFGADDEYRSLYERAIARLRGLNATPVEIDFAPFVEVRKLLYEGPWIAERAAALGPYLLRYAAAIDPAVRQSLATAEGVSAEALFEAMHRLAQLRRDTEAVWEAASYLLLPAAPTIYRLQQIAGAPLALNAQLGCYTNFVNLLGLAAVNVPGGFRSDGLPFGLSLVGPAHSDRVLALLAGRLHAALGEAAGARREVMPAPPAEAPAAAPGIQLAVVGAHLSGLPLNHELITRGGRLVARTSTAACYRLYLLDSALGVQRPGMVRVEAGEEGAALEVEVWEMPLEQFGAFVAMVPPPLAIGTVDLTDGRRVKGFVCERYAVRGARDISAYGGWREWLAHTNK
jgi:allophanate hydrolase